MTKKETHAEQKKDIFNGNKTGAMAHFRNFLKATYRQAVLSAFLFYAMAMPVAADAGAADAGAADAKWDTIVGFITPWITRIGGLILLFGAVELAIAFKDDNADKKTSSIRFVVAGLIVIAVGLSSDLFLK